MKFFHPKQAFSIKNSKLETKSYNFSIDSTKFCQNFNFEFEEIN